MRNKFYSGLKVKCLFVRIINLIYSKILIHCICRCIVLIKSVLHEDILLFIISIKKINSIIACWTFCPNGNSNSIQSRWLKVFYKIFYTLDAYYTITKENIFIWVWEWLLPIYKLDICRMYIISGIQRSVNMLKMFHVNGERSIDSI